MSSKYVRDLVEGWLEDVGMSVPYYPTINEEQKPTDDMWCSADFSSSFRETITFCQGDTNEEGEVEVLYFGKAGIGDDSLLTAIEADMQVLMAQRDPANKMVLLNRSAPFETTNGSASGWYGLSIYIDYQYYE